MTQQEHQDLEFHLIPTNWLCTNYKIIFPKVSNQPGISMGYMCTHLDILHRYRATLQLLAVGVLECLDCIIDVFKLLRRGTGDIGGRGT